MRTLTAPLAVLALCALGPAPAWPVSIQEHSGMCDASAAVAAGPGLFVVANDEDDVLRLYRTDGTGGLLASRDITGLLGHEEEGEADLEGAARLAGSETVYWITSHGRNKNGKERPNRLRLIALQIRATDSSLTVEPVGVPYKSLLKDLQGDSRFKKLDLGKAVAPEDKDGTNIEGLTSWRGDQLLIGFRNPIPDQQALLIPLINPAEVVQGKPARFGDPIRLDLDGRGVRSIEYLPREDAYLIVAGPFNSKGSFLLYRWCGDPGHKPERIENADLAPLRPEALVDLPEEGEILLLSDDGDEQVGGEACKDLQDPEKQSFRSRRIPLPGSPR